MTVRTTSREAYGSVLPGINDRQLKVLHAIKLALRPVCNQEIASYLSWPINTVTPRVKELREKGLVEEAGRAVYTPTGRTVIHWKATDE